MKCRIISMCLLACFSLLSCNKSDKIPDSVIDKEKMGVILFDLAMAEGYLEVYSFKDSTLNKDSMLLVELDKVLAVHKVSQKDFTGSYHFYKTHPEIFKVVTDTLFDRTQRSRENMFGNKPEKLRIRKEKRKNK